MRLFLLAAVSLAASNALAQPPGRGPQAAPPQGCEAILPPRQVPPGKRMLFPEDLARLRDIGPDDPEAYAEPVFTLSPDGRSAAFQLRRGDPAHNSYCLAMVILDLAGNNQPRVVDLGDDPLLVTLDLRGIADFPTGLMRVITPRWSRDGKWIAFLKRSGGTVQVWRAWVDGCGSAPLTRSKSDVVDFRVGSDGSSIIFVTRPDVDRQRRKIAADGRNGWHYDERFVPFVSKAPLPKMPVERHVQVLELPLGRLRPPSAKEAAVLVEDHRIIANSGDRPVIDEAGIEIDATDITGGARPGTFHARLGNGSTVTCAAEACNGAKSPWWMPRKDHVRFFRREGWARASTAIYDWDVVRGDVRRIYLTDDVLSSCAPSAATIICRIDSSLRPGRLVRLEPLGGERETLFDPNPEFAHFTLGKAERLHFRNGMGSETIADLVFPVGYRVGEKVPMVVVQYETRGFLRGGTDDEYPIQAFANRGYAVFSFKRPQLASTLNAEDYDEFGRQNLRQFADRRNVQASLDAGVRLVVDRGIADPARIGITGLSDGSTTVEWALIHSSLFSAAAMSSCCWDPTLMAQVGPAAARHFLDEGYPGVLDRNDAFWKDVSLSDNARRITTPILVNASEEEFLGAVLTYTALREAGVPVDMFEFPNEFHARWQPAHRLATYKRSLDWFDYWLRGRRSNDPVRQPELKEWDRLRRESGRGRPI
jgi:dipeptidyl aminopeptidase/acylaminoacyl peptidase